MSKADRAIDTMYRLDHAASKDQWVNRIHPLVMFVVTVVYIGIVVSFQKYDLMGLIGMVVYLFVMFQLADLSFLKCLERLKIVLPIAALVGIGNVFVETTVVMIGNMHIRIGVISMLTLMLKGIFSVLASYILVNTTTIEEICYALRLLHVPDLLVTQVLLTYRYIFVLLQEVSRITQAYSLRAPGQKGVHFKAWGSLAGQLLLHTIDRANDVYESMTLRGFRGEYAYLVNQKKIRKTDIIFLVVWILLFVFARKVPYVVLIGGLFG